MKSSPITSRTLDRVIRARTAAEGAANVTVGSTSAIGPSPGDREPPEHEAEEQDQQDAGPERRHRDAQHREAHDQGIHPSASTYGGDNAQRYPDNRRDHNRAQRQGGRRRQAFDDFVQHRLATADGCPEIAL